MEIVEGVARWDWHPRVRRHRDWVFGRHAWTGSYDPESGRILAVSDFLSMQFWGWAGTYAWGAGVSGTALETLDYAHCWQEVAVDCAPVPDGTYCDIGDQASTAEVCDAGECTGLGRCEIEDVGEIPGEWDAISPCGDHVCLLDEAGLSSYDISDPNTPVRLADLGISAAGLVSLGDLLFLHAEDQLRAQRVDEAGAFEQLGHVALDCSWARYAAAPDAALVFAACHGEDVHVFDVSLPEQPVVAAAFALALAGSADIEYVEGGWLFAWSGNDVEVWNVSVAEPALRLHQRLPFDVSVVRHVVDDRVAIRSGALDMWVWDGNDLVFDHHMLPHSESDQLLLPREGRVVGLWPADPGISTSSQRDLVVWGGHWWDRLAVLASHRFEVRSPVLLERRGTLVVLARGEDARLFDITSCLP